MNDTQQPAPPIDSPRTRRQFPVMTTVIAVAALLIGGITGWAATAATLTPTIEQQAEKIQSLDERAKTAGSTLSATFSELADLKRQLWTQNEITDREAAVAEAETEVAKREEEITTTRESIEKRESDLVENEDSNWWISQVRECLSRPGSDRMATVSEGSLIGSDITCVTM